MSVVEPLSPAVFDGGPAAPSPPRSDRERLMGLVNANRALVGGLELPEILRHVVETARALLDARYAALGILDASGTELEQFIHTGMDAETVAAIGHLPRGGGLLGVVVTEARPVRAASVAADPRSCGVPPGHPPLRTFLGVPVRMGGTVFGNLYLADSGHGPFTAGDEEILVSLAATAGIAIENAQRLEGSRHRQLGLEACAVVTRQLLAREGENPLQLIARTLSTLAAADLVTVVLPTADRRRLIVEVAVGEHCDELVAMPVPLADSLAGQVMQSGQPRLILDAERRQPMKIYSTIRGRYGPVMALPLAGAAGVRGVLTVARRPAGLAFTEADVQTAAMFAAHATVALELADAQADQQRVALLEDRDRIARDLHDHVIQRLFGAGLRLQSMAVSITGTDMADRLIAQTEDLDDIIRQIRTTIFQLRGPQLPGGSALREQVLDIVAELRPALGFDPQVQFSGPIDALADLAVTAEMSATLREALTNVVRHAGATEARVSLAVADGQASLDVIDNGVGIGPAGRRSGLANLAARAKGLGGRLDVVAAAPAGTHLRMTVPLAAANRSVPPSNRLGR